MPFVLIALSHFDEYTIPCAHTGTRGETHDD